MSNIKTVPSKSRLNVFPTVDIPTYLKQKGIQFQDKGDWVRLNCPFPDHDDKNPSFFIHKTHGGWNCYSRCGTGNWIELCKKLGWTDYEKMPTLVDVVPEVIWNNIQDVFNDVDDIVLSDSRPDFYEKINTHNIKHKKYILYIEKRDINYLLNHYDIYCSWKFDKRFGHMYNNRIMIPVHDGDGKFLWFEGRSILPVKKRKYYRPDGVNKTNVLFNLHRTKNENYTILVEGIIDSMILFANGFSSNCCFGSDVSDEQIKLLSRYRKIMVCLDNDEAGIKGYVKLKNKLLNIGLHVSRIVMPRNKDVNDIGIKHFRYLFDNRESLMY